MTEADEHANVLAERFSASFGRVDREARKARERTVVRTPAERAKSAALRTELINFKTTKATRTLLRQLAAELDVTMTEVIERGIAMVAEARSKTQ